MPNLAQNAKSEKRGAKCEKSGAKYLAIHFLFFTFHDCFHIFRDKCIAGVMDTLFGGHLNLADIFLGPVKCDGLNILKPLLNGHSIN